MARGPNSLPLILNILNVLFILHLYLPVRFSFLRRLDAKIASTALTGKSVSVSFGK